MLADGVLWIIRRLCEAICCQFIPSMLTDFRQLVRVNGKLGHVVQIHLCRLSSPHVIHNLSNDSAFHQALSAISVGRLWHSHGKNPVRLYPKLQSHPIGLRKIFIDYLFFQADQSDCTKSVSIFNYYLSIFLHKTRTVPFIRACLI